MVDIVGNYFENAREPEWMEKPVVGSIRAWQVMFLSLGGVTTIVVAICCCFRFRVPRTKQQIEADHKRRVITNKFRQKLEKIQDAKMDALSLKDALSLLHAECCVEMEAEPDSQRSSIVSPILNSLEPQGDCQKPEPQVLATGAPGNMVKFATKVTNINRLTNKSPSDHIINF